MNSQSQSPFFIFCLLWHFFMGEWYCYCCFSYNWLFFYFSSYIKSFCCYSFSFNAAIFVFAAWSSFLNSFRVYGVRRSLSNFKALIYWSYLSLFKRRGRLTIAFAFFWKVSSKIISSIEGRCYGSFRSILWTSVSSSSLMSEFFYRGNYSPHTLLFNSSLV